MKKLRCCIIDDEPLALELIKKYALKTHILELVGAYTSVAEAVQTVVSGELDLVFLDIQMTELNGIEFAAVVPKHTRIIYITAHQQYAVDSYKVNALDYLLKPVDYKEFVLAVKKAVAWFNLEERAGDGKIGYEPKTIFVKSDYKLMQIDISKILYVEGYKDYAKIYIEGADEPIVSLVGLRALEAYLPKTQFARVHRSFIVHITKIKMIERNRIIFGKQYIPISETYKNAFYGYISQLTLSSMHED